MFLDSPTQMLEVSFSVKYDDGSYMVYASMGHMKCLEYGGVGHKWFACPHKQQEANAVASVMACDEDVGGERTVEPAAAVGGVDTSVDTGEPIAATGRADAFAGIGGPVLLLGGQMPLKIPVSPLLLLGGGGGCLCGCRWAHCCHWGANASVGTGGPSGAAGGWMTPWVSVSLLLLLGGGCLHGYQ